MTDTNPAFENPAMKAIDGRSTRYANHRLQRREAILTQTTRILAKHGLRSLTIDEFAQKLGLAKPALYRYFHSKDDLIQSALTQASEAIVEADISAKQTDWRGHLRGAIHFVYHQPETFIILHRYAANDPKYNSYFKIYFEQVKHLTSERLIKFSGVQSHPDIKLEFYAKALTATILSATQTWIDDGLWDVDIFHKWLVSSVVSLTQTWTDFEA